MKLPSHENPTTLKVFHVVRSVEVISIPEGQGYSNHAGHGRTTLFALTESGEPISFDIDDRMFRRIFGAEEEESPEKVATAQPQSP